APLHVGRPNVPEVAEVLRRVERALVDRWLTNDGPRVAELEAICCRRLGARHCVAVANATLGLALCARALGLDGEVVLPSFTFVGSAHAMAWLGLTPVFCDIGAESYQIDPRHADALVTERTSAIIG